METTHRSESTVRYRSGGFNPGERPSPCCFVQMLRAPSPPRSRILLAAKELFFQRGFARVSTDDLAQAASVSKATLYRHFEGLNGVLRAVVEAEVESFEQGVPTDAETKEEFSEALCSFGSNLLAFLNRPEIIRFSQLMFEEARSHPDLASDFYSCAYGRTQDDLSRLIQQGMDFCFLRSELNARDLAEQLLGLWEGFGFVRALLGLTNKPFENPEEWSRSCVHTLLNGQESGANSRERIFISVGKQ